jgi:tetratricopeptide (TPR) repeat protein
MGRVELGAVLLAQGEIDLAQRTEEEALRLAREVGLKPGEAQGQFQLGQIALASGDLPAARRHQEEALAIRRALNETRTISESRLALAELSLEEGRVGEAEHEARELLNELRNEPEGPLQMEIQVLIAQARLALGDPDAADKALAVARRLSQSTERIDDRRLLTMAEAGLDAAQGRPDRARERLTSLRASLARAGMTLAELECRMAMLRLDRAEKRPDAHTEAIALEKDARARRAGLVLRHVQAL